MYIHIDMPLSIVSLDIVSVMLCNKAPIHYACTDLWLCVCV